MILIGLFQKLKTCLRCFVVFLFIISAPLNVFSISQDDAKYLYTPFYDPDDGVGLSCSLSVSGTGALPVIIPEPYRTIFEAAAAEFEIDPVALAITHAIEQNGGSLDFREPPPPYGTGPAWPGSSAGAQGPFQFMPSTWTAYGVDGNNDGVKDIQDLTDAAFGAAKYLKELGASAGAPFGDPENPYTEEDTLVQAWVGYNWGPGNVRNKRLPLPTETKNYLQKAQTLYQQLNPGGSTSATGENAGSSSCGGIGVSSDGFVFPLLTTKLTVINDIEISGTRWCYENENNCHHDYNAADIFVPTGTVVVAARGGTVRSIKNDGGTYGSNVQIIGDDGNLYYYTHMGAGTIAVVEGDLVTAGQPIGEIGTDENAVGTPRHLHIDVLPSQYTSSGRPSCSGAECTQPFINIQPPLIESFNNLPD